MADDLTADLDAVRAGVASLLRRRSLSAFAAREVLDSIESIDAWLHGDGDEGEENARVDRFSGALEALHAAEGRR